MNRDDLAQRLLGLFIQELDEQLSALDPAVVALEQRPTDAALIQTIFRIAHTIKGAARAAGVSLVEDAFHELESLFDRVRSGERALEADQFITLFAAVDAFKDAASRLRAGSTDLNASPLAMLMPSLRQAATAGPSARQPAGAPPPTQPPAQVVIDIPTQAPEVIPSMPAAPTPDAHAHVRVSVTALERLAASATEILLTAGGDPRRTEQAVTTLSAQIRALRQARFGDVTAGLERTARDLAADAGKQVQLIVTGEEIEADRVIMDALREPLLHLVRNAVDHGI